MYSFHQIETLVKSSAQAVPLDIFAFLGSFIEEIIPPIPAPLIMTTAGSFALTQQHTWIFLIWIAIIGSVGKTIASWIFYILGDTFEDVVVGRFGKFVGIGHRDVENLGKRFNGGWRDSIALFALRSIPVFPSVSVSIVCGVIRLNIRHFIGATFFGTIVKNLIYLYAGYGGMKAIGFAMRRMHHVTFWLGIVFLIVSLVIIYRLVKKRRDDKGKDVFENASL